MPSETLGFPKTVHINGDKATYLVAAFLEFCYTDSYRADLGLLIELELYFFADHLAAQELKDFVTKSLLKKAKAQIGVNARIWCWTLPFILAAIYGDTASFMGHREMKQGLVELVAGTVKEGAQKIHNFLPFEGVMKDYDEFAEDLRRRNIKFLEDGVMAVVCVNCCWKFESETSILYQLKGCLRSSRAPGTCYGCWGHLQMLVQLGTQVEEPNQCSMASFCG